MHILILGSGGREHSLAWAIKQNPKCDKLTCAPGNAGMAALATIASDLDVDNGADVLSYVEENGIDFVVIGPEAPLAAGVADILREAGILCFGPSKAAAALEASKAFTKEICDASGAPTAAYARFDQLEPAKAYVKEQGAPIVIKADGLAAGKGVIVAMSEAEALDGLDYIFGGAFGDAGAEVVIEEFMEGEEASFFILADKNANLLPIGTAQDHKRAFDGDEGPNTGGMGAYSPAPILSEDLQAQVMAQIIKPTVDEMAKRGTPFEGVLYAGLMIKEGQARLVEYNVRFGDPECQALMLRLGGQVLDALLACAQGQLDQVKLNWANDHAMTVVMAANGYPGSYQKGTVINGLDRIAQDATQQVFHAGTAKKGEQITAIGGRVLNITARGETLKEAHARAYRLIAEVNWPDGFNRSDIGWRAL